MLKMFAPSAITPPSCKNRACAIMTVVIVSNPAMGPNMTARSVPPIKCPEVPPRTGNLSICAAKIKTVDDVFCRSENLIVLSAESEKRLTELENFLMENFYLHKSVIQAADKIKEWLSRLFEKFCDRPELMPGYFQRLISTEGLQRSVCDYIAGMTDRFCQKMLKD